jgi:DNA-binding MarR family transcriptional regulator
VRETAELSDPLKVLERGEIFSAQHRFTIMFLLYLHEKAGFTELQRLLGVTPGNLDHHLRKLAEVGYVKTRHVLDWRPLKVVEITSLGAREFRDYAVGMRELLNLIE